jgi:hypothetical protein
MLDDIRISCHAALDAPACAPFRKERRMKAANANNVPQEIRVRRIGLGAICPDSSSTAQP